MPSPFNQPLVDGALSAAFANKNVGDILLFPGSEPVFSYGATLGAAPSALDISGIPVVSYQLNVAYLFMKYAFTVDTLQYMGILDNNAFKNMVKMYYQQNYKAYITSVLPAGTVYKEASLDDILYNVNEVNGARICTITCQVKYWFKLT